MTFYTNVYLFHLKAIDLNGNVCSENLEIFLIYFSFFF